MRQGRAGHDGLRRVLAQRESNRHGIGIEAASSARQAVTGADLICTVTAAHEPVLFGEWLSPGAHINAVGACIPKTRELDHRALLRSRLFVDRRESALNEAGDFLIPRSEGIIDEQHILGELGDVLAGTTPGRTDADDITLFKSLGLAVEDLAAAHHIYTKAVDDEAIPRVVLGGLRE